MPAANVRTLEDNYAVRVEGIEGVYNSIAIPAKKGPISEPTLISGEDQLLKIFTPNLKVEVGFSMAYYSALAVLQKTNSLWVTRVANGALYGGVLVNKSTDLTVYSQVGQLTEAQSAMSFNVSAISDASLDVVVSGLQGGVMADFADRDILIEGVGAHTVDTISGSTLTLTAMPTQSITFSDTNDSGVIPAVDYISFDVNYGQTGETTTVVYITGLSEGLATDLVGNEITLFDGSDKFVRTVDSVVGTEVTLTAATPVIVNRVDVGFSGTPEVTFDVSGVADAGTTIEVSNISPSHITETDDMDGETATLTLNMTDGTQTAVSTTLTWASGTGLFTVTAFADPALPTDSTGTAAAIAATATGFADPSAITQTSNGSTFALSAKNEGDWSTDLRIEILTGQEVKEENAFIVRVFGKDNLNVPLETWEMSRVEAQKNGYGRTMFIDTMLDGSSYINGWNNVLVDDSILPKETVTRDEDGNVLTRSFIELVAGDDGDAVTDSDMITAADLMASTNSYPLSVMLDGGWATPAYQIRLAQICETRDDAVAILSVPYDVEASSTDYATEIVNYRNLDLNLNSSYAALYSCHVKITDKYNDRVIYVSPDGYAAAAINYSASNYEIWYPAAGYKRGKLNVEGVLRRFTDGELDYLYDSGINPIRFAPGKGIAIWGQLTLVLRPSIKDRLNVRLMLNEVKPAIANSLEQILFELNEVRVRNIVEIMIKQYLDGVKTRNGLTDFYVVCNDTNNSSSDMDNHILNVDVYLKPLHSIEYINFTTILTNTGVEFASIA